MVRTPRPTDGELEILNVLWNTGPATVRQVHEVIARRKPAQYTTVLKTLQIMAEKGLVRRDEKQRAHLYRASVPRAATERQLVGHLLRHAFSGSVRNLVLGALAEKKASPEELAEIRRLLHDYGKGNSGELD